MDNESKELNSSSDYATNAATHDINSIILYPFAHQVRNLIDFYIHSGALTIASYI